ncbi:unnamed protein product [[Candida] boidinii]|uniref:Unnamed protein product n=1 Tax=Candida boidinii TaxID=5477 RepID=A0A9W6WDV1_CANBO|nr:unnamed protein product [[Candida] boidinii]
MVLKQNGKEFNLDYWLSVYLSNEDVVSDRDEVSQNLVISLLDDIVNLIRHEYKDLIFKEKKENDIGKLLGFRPSYQNYGVILQLNEILKDYLIRIEDEEDLENLEVITNLNIIYVNYFIETKASSIQEGNEESNLYLILNKFYKYIGIIFENIRDGNVVNESLQVPYIDLINKYFNLVVNISSYQDFDNTKYLHEYGGKKQGISSGENPFSSAIDLILLSNSVMSNEELSKVAETFDVRSSMETMKIIFDDTEYAQGDKNLMKFQYLNFQSFIIFNKLISHSKIFHEFKENFEELTLLFHSNPLIS